MGACNLDDYTEKWADVFTFIGLPISKRVIVKRVSTPSAAILSRHLRVALILRQFQAVSKEFQYQGEHATSLASPSIQTLAKSNGSHSELIGMIMEVDQTYFSGRLAAMRQDLKCDEIAAAAKIRCNAGKNGTRRTK
jgi:hypothetical protein